MTILEQVKRLVADLAGCDPASIGDHQPLDHSRPDGLDLDSLDRLQLILDVEEEFGLPDIPDDDVDQLEASCSAIARYVEMRL